MYELYMAVHASLFAFVHFGIVATWHGMSCEYFCGQMSGGGEKCKPSEIL